MPVPDRSSYPIERDLPETPTPGLEFMTEARLATSSPSPLLKILQDPTLMGRRSEGDHKKSRRRPSDSPHRSHRSPMVMAIALVEEEKQAYRLKSLLRNSTDRLEYEMRRADEAELRAEFAERREREALAKVSALEAAQQRERERSNRLESDCRNYQMQLEVAEREIRRLQADFVDAERETEELQELEAKTQEMYDKSQSRVYELEMSMREREEEVEESLVNTFEDGRSQGYKHGYRAGYKDGRKKGPKSKRRTIGSDEESL